VTLHFLFHGCHHRYPHDGLRLVMPPLPGAGIALCIFSVLRCALPPAEARIAMAGLLAGYVHYDMLHYAIHHASSSGVGDGGAGAAGRLAAACCGVWLPRLRANHLRHHYGNPDAGYGISSTWLDTLLHTRPRTHWR
jgi:dihydroceramide fatty acyl 2-hydroxylase